MVIQHNLLSMNADRMLGINSRKLAGSTEKLVSGYKINRAADDAAGLSISEKMRKRIRGLERGMENVEDGISLCQVADGALNEATELIQRMRELSIQAYNGTNSKSDRQTIQGEIDQSIKELDRIFETTKFNEVSVFRNGTRVKGTAFNAQEHTERRTTTTYRNKPGWLEINDGSSSRIEVHPGYLTGTAQYADGIMKQDFNNGSIKVYFGPDKGNQGGYQWVGSLQKTNPAAYNQLMARPDFKAYMDKHTNNGTKPYTGWTSTIDDNVSAKLNFGNLAKVTDASELYSKLGELVGVEVGYPCGTCVQKEAIRFSGTINGINGMTFQDSHLYVTKGEINLSKRPFAWDNKAYTGYFDAVVDVMAMEDTDPDKATKTKSLAEAIAADLAGATYDTLSSVMTNHYDRAARAANDPYSVYIYDYRDADAIKLTSGSADSTIITSGRVTMTYDETVTTGYYTHYDYWDGNQIWIQASDGTPDGLFIFDKRLSAETLGLENYRVDTYVTEVEMEDPEGYQKKLAEWYAAAPTPVITPYEVEETVRVMTKAPVYTYWTTIEAGETKTHSKLVSPAEWTTTTQKVTRYNISYPNDTRGPRPTPNILVHEKYDPSKLEVLDDALTTISEVRSYFGAVQNRLEHTYNNNYNAMENMTYAESKIRDTDMAEETVRKSMLDILQQAGFSMLSQANQSKQGISMLLS